MTMIERLARARCIVKGYDPDQMVSWPQGGGTTEERPRWSIMADAVRTDLDVMREPTPEMVKAAKSRTAAKVWSAMIDEAMRG